MMSEQMARYIGQKAAEGRERVLETADFIWKNPETGFREWKTSAFLAEEFGNLGFEPVFMGNIPGFYVDLDTGRPGPAVALLAELDSVICAGHPDADAATGAVHACGHHTQCAGLVGAAAVLRDPRVLDSLSGKVRFVVVPAEELIENEFRASLREQGIIRYFGGKVEFLYRGVFDAVDGAVMLHSGGIKTQSLAIYKGNNGCLVKNIFFKGRAAHAGGAPHLGVNALSAAVLGIGAVNALRETFKEADVTRFHPIITSGGSAVNVIPEEARLESYVRGASAEAMVNENKKINRALAGAALSVGAEVRVADSPGYLPLHNDRGLNEVAREAGAALFGADRIDYSERWVAGSTDMGDLCAVMPVTQPSGGGGSGTPHGSDYRIVNGETACVDGARFLAGMAVSLLADGARELKRVKEAYRPAFPSKKEYFAFIDSLSSDRSLVTYEGESASIVW